MAMKKVPVGTAHMYEHRGGERHGSAMIQDIDAYLNRRRAYYNREGLRETEMSETRPHRTPYSVHKDSAFVQRLDEKMKHYNQAEAELGGLTRAERGLYFHHLRELYDRNNETIDNDKREASSLKAMTVQGPDGRTYIVPTMWDGKVHTPEQAIQNIGESLTAFPSYATHAEAIDRYKRLHQYMEQDVPVAFEFFDKATKPAGQGILPDIDPSVDFRRGIESDYAGPGPRAPDQTVQGGTLADILGNWRPGDPINDASDLEGGATDAEGTPMKASPMRFSPGDLPGTSGQVGRGTFENQMYGQRLLNERMGGGPFQSELQRLQGRVEGRTLDMYAGKEGQRTLEQFDDPNHPRFGQKETLDYGEVFPSQRENIADRPQRDFSANKPTGSDLQMFVSQSGLNIRNGVDMNAPYMNRPRKLEDIKRIITHGDVVENADSLLRYGRRVDPARKFDPGYHFYVGRDGSITQGAPLDRITNHTWKNNGDTIGIVFAGADGGKKPSAAQRKVGLQLISDLGTAFKIDPKGIMGHGELQPHRRHRSEGGDIAKVIREGGYLPVASQTVVANLPTKPTELAEKSTVPKPVPAERPAAAEPPQTPITKKPATGLSAPPIDPMQGLSDAPTAMGQPSSQETTPPGTQPGPTLTPPATTAGGVGSDYLYNLQNQEGQPSASGTPAPGLPGTVVASPGSDEFSQVTVPDFSGAPQSGGGVAGQPTPGGTDGRPAEPQSALSQWKPGEPIGAALLSDIFGIGGGKGGLFGGGGKMPAFHNYVQVPNLPDLGAQLLQIAGPEANVLPTMPEPPPAPPRTPQGMRSYASNKRRKQLGYG